MQYNHLIKQQIIKTNKNNKHEEKIIPNSNTSYNACLRRM